MILLLVTVVVEVSSAGSLIAVIDALRSCVAAEDGANGTAAFFLLFLVSVVVPAEPSCYEVSRKCHVDVGLTMAMCWSGRD